MKGNQTTLLLGRLPGDRASWTKPNSEGRREDASLGMKGKAENTGGFMPHYTPGSAPDSSQSPHLSKHHPLQGGTNKGLHIPSPCLLGQQTLQSNSLLPLLTKDPAVGPGSPQSSCTHNAPSAFLSQLTLGSSPWGSLPFPYCHYPPGANHR